MALKRRLKHVVSVLADIIWRVRPPAKCAILRGAFVHFPPVPHLQRRVLSAFLRNSSVEELLAFDYSRAVREPVVAETLLAFLRKGMRDGNADTVRKAGLLLLCHGDGVGRTVAYGISSLAAGGLLDDLLGEAAGILTGNARCFRAARRNLVEVLDAFRPSSAVLDALDDGCLHVLDGAGDRSAPRMLGPVAFARGGRRSRIAQAADLGLGTRVLVLAEQGINMARLGRRLKACGSLTIVRADADTDAGRDVSRLAGKVAWALAENATQLLVGVAGPAEERPDWLADCGDAIRYALAHRFYEPQRQFLALTDALAGRNDDESIVLAMKDGAIGCALSRRLLRERRGAQVWFWLEGEGAIDRIESRQAEKAGSPAVSGVHARLTDRVRHAVEAWNGKLPDREAPAGDWRLLTIDLHSRGERYSIAGRALLAESLQRGAVAIVQRQGVTTEAAAKLVERALRDAGGGERCLLLREIGSPAAVDTPDESPSSADTESAGLEVIGGIEGPVDQALCGEILFSFSRDTLPGIFRDGRLLHALFSKRPPAVVIACPVDSLELRLAAAAARRRGVATLGFANMFPSATPLQQPPPGDFLAVRDRAGGRFYAETFGIGPDRMLVAGSPELEALRRAVEEFRRAHPPLPGLRILVATQPLYGDRFEDIIACVAECIRGMDAVFTTVRPHPAEPPAEVSRYRSACARQIREGAWAVEADQPWHAALAQTHVLVTLFSNAGLDAAAAGARVIVMNLRRECLPISLDKLGIATEVQSRADAMRLFAALAAGGPSFHGDEGLRGNAFFAENPELLNPGAAGRILDFLRDRGAARKG